MDGLRVAALGSLMATYDGEELHIGGKVPRRVVGRLAASADLWASDRDLAEAVWLEHGPEWEDRMPTLRTTVSRLNDALPGVGGGRRIGREHDGYRLVLGADELDIAVFESCCEAASEAMEAGQPEHAEELAREALAQWRGRPFDELADVPFVVRRAEELVREWRDVQRVLVEALLATGQAGEAVTEARELVDTEPDNARWVKLHALALHRSGRNDRAIEVCQTHARARIDRGLVRDTELADLEHALLENDPALEWDPPIGDDGRRPVGPKTLVFVGAAEAPGGNGRRPGSSARSAFEAVVRRAVVQHQGFAFDRDGLGFCVVFERPDRAVAAACEIARGVRDSEAAGGLWVTTAVHTGTADRQGALFVGPTVAHVARLRNAAHPGQVLVSAVTRILVADDLPAGVTLRDVGAWQFDGSERADRVYQLVHAELPEDFPPLRAGSRTAGRLPGTRTLFVGRAQELAEVTGLLGAGPLVTITGEGGIGKTRLAVETGMRVAPSYPDGVRFCDVSLADEDTLDDHVAAAIGLVVTTDSDHRQEIVDSLHESRLLLILDGCEHLSEAAAALVEHVLGSDPAARLLVTSRVRLEVPGEQVVNLGTLTLPNATDPDPGRAPAVELLVDRARAVDAEVSAADPQVVELARRLEGLPLAIELVAIRLASIPAATLVERLDQSFEAFIGPPDLPDRLRTLRATFEWSFEMVDPAGRKLLGALSVFRGTWSLEAAEAVAAAVDVEPGRVMALIAELVDLSIVRVQTSGRGTARYRMLDTIRTYAAAHLAGLGRTDAVADLHAHHFLGLAERAVPHRRGPDEPAWVGELAAEFDNLRAAHRHLTDHGRPVEALRLVAALGDELLMRERLEIGRWAAALAVTPAVAEEPLLVAVLGLAANAAMLEGRLTDALALANRALDAAERISGAPPAWMAHNVLAMAPLANGFGRERWGRHIRAMEHISDQLDDPFPRALALWNRVFVAEWTKTIALAEAAAHDLLALGDRYDNPSIRSMGLHAQGRVAVLHRDPGEARDWFMQALGAAEAARNTLMINTTARELADRASDLGDHRTALAALCRIARSFIASGNIREQAPTAVRIIDHLVILGELLPAARALVCLQRSPLRRTAECEGLLARAKAGLSPAEWDDALHDGAALQLDHVLTELVRVADDLADRLARDQDDPGDADHPDDVDHPDDPDGAVAGAAKANGGEQPEPAEHAEHAEEADRAEGAEPEQVGP